MKIKSLIIPFIEFRVKMSYHFKRFLFMVFFVAVVTGCSASVDDPDDTGGPGGPGGPEAAKVEYTLTAWSDQGMHFSDDDYSVFSLLPPHNTLQAQLTINGAVPRVTTSDITVTYESTDSLDGTTNSSSADKTNFWNYALQLFPSLNSLADDMGLSKNPVQSTTPKPMTFSSKYMLWKAEGIPTIPENDSGDTQHFPMVKVVAKKDGKILAQTTTVIPVSTEMNCVKCHGFPDTKRDILTKHDANNPDAVMDNLAALVAKGYDYKQSGLIATVDDGTPILCASCHKTNALENSGISGISALTTALHAKHALVNDPNTGLALASSKNRSTCYLCHPGESTKPLRGAMGSAVDGSGANIIECQNCHGNMNAVAKDAREGWLDEPNCQACHQDGKRHTVAVTDYDDGTLRASADERFATENDKPSAGKNLYRYSTGHGGNSCAVCHGSPHAIYPSSLKEDNLQSIAHQGHAGTLMECDACHAGDMVTTADRGPHGMHSIGQKWVDRHGSHVLRKGTDDCKYCHGNNLAGTPLSKTSSSRAFDVLGKKDKVNFSAKHEVACKDCHVNN